MLGTEVRSEESNEDLIEEAKRIADLQSHPLLRYLRSAPSAGFATLFDSDGSILGIASHREVFVGEDQKIPLFFFHKEIDFSSKWVFLGAISMQAACIDHIKHRDSIIDILDDVTSNCEEYK